MFLSVLRVLKANTLWYLTEKHVKRAKTGGAKMMVGLLLKAPDGPRSRREQGLFYVGHSDIYVLYRYDSICQLLKCRHIKPEGHIKLENFVENGKRLF